MPERRRALTDTVIAAQASIVNSAQAGTHGPSQLNLDSRVRGYDASVTKRRDAARLALGRMRHLVAIFTCTPFCRSAAGFETAFSPVFTSPAIAVNPPIFSPGVTGTAIA